MAKWNKIILAPDSFKGSLSSPRICEIMSKEISKFYPQARILQFPMADGGEGILQVLIKATGGRMLNKQVTDPLGRSIRAYWGILRDGRTAIIEMAAASGLNLLSRDERDPLNATTFGTGQLIKAALDEGCRKIIIGIGGSATNDGGAGMAQALGARLLDDTGREIGWGGQNLISLRSIDLTAMDPRLKETEVVAASDVNNPLCGPEGATAVYAPQKGCPAEMISFLDKALHHYASVIKTEMQLDVLEVPGSGAAGGFGAGVLAFLNGKLRPGVDIVLEYTGFEEALADKERTLILTGEGEINFQTIRGKVPCGIARAAKKHGIPVIAVVGGIGPGAELVYEQGIDAIFSIVPGPSSLQEAIANAEENLKEATQRLCRILAVD